jgi:glycerol-3-phosphate dehydrogenase
MRRDLESLSLQTFDLAVIGGGIQGAATAREAALRGLKVALVEARDFGSGTSSRSSKLIHGGLRYLEQLDFKLVGEARRERRRLLELAPHLSQPIPFLLPIYRGDPYSPLKVRVGLSIYDLMGNLGPQDRHRMLSPEAARGRVPALRPEGLRAAALYHDSQTEDARLTLENVLDAAEHGAAVANYAEVRALSMSGRSGGDHRKVLSAEVEDVLTGQRYEVSARFWVNAAGPWVDHVRALLPGFDGSKTVRLTKGTHVTIPPVTGDYALLAAILPGDRVFLIVPWGNYALLGTTDTDYQGDPAAVAPEPSESEYLLTAANRVLHNPLQRSDVVGSWTGLRALALEPQAAGPTRRAPSAHTREYRFHEDPWVKNFVSICGGKLTTHRALGEKLVDLLLRRCRECASQAVSGRPTRTAPLPGGRTGPFRAFVKSATEEAVREFALPASVAERIVRTYGSRWREVLEPTREQKSLAELLPGSPALLAAEVDFGARHEMALKVEDFLLRRSGLSWKACTLAEAAPAVAQILAARLGWRAEERQKAVETFTRSASGLRPVASGQMPVSSH